MAATNHTDELKIFVDKEKNKLLFAEVDRSFVDSLFGFLTLPFGTVVKLLSNKAQSHQVTVGCFNDLYESVMNLDHGYFYNKVCKDMLLLPRSPLEEECQKLKIDTDCTQTPKYFLCYNRSVRGECACLISIYKNIPCSNCGREMGYESFPGGKIYQTYVFGANRFIITDDLQVMPLMPGTVIGLFNKLCIQDFNVVEERTEKLGLNQWLDLFKWIFLSTTPLTDLFVLKRKLPDRFTPEKLKVPLPNGHCFDKEKEVKKMNVKVTLKRSSKEVLFVESQEDFIDFLFSFLTIPLGQMVRILDGQSGLPSIDGLYKSIQALDTQYFISEDDKNKLLRPKLAAHLSTKNQLIPLETDNVKLCMHGKSRTIVNPNGFNRDGFVRGQEVYMVTDNLCVTPFTTGSAISILNRSKCLVGDIEERTLTLGAAEGLSILRASLNSTSALTNGLFHNLALKKPKQEM